MPTINCARCGKETELRDRGKPKRFCSPICRIDNWNESKRKPRTDRECLGCGTTFKPWERGGCVQKWCTAECRTASRRRPLAKKVCLQCGQSFVCGRFRQVLCGNPDCRRLRQQAQTFEKYHNQSGFREGAIASHRRTYERQKAQRVVNCLHCHKEIRGKATAWVCSIECARANRVNGGMTAAQARLLEKEARRTQRLGISTTECLWCGDDFEAIEGEQYCSDDCQYEDATERLSER